MELDIVSIWVRNSLVIPLYLVFSIFLLNTTTIVKKGLFLNYFSDKVKSKLDNLKIPPHPRQPGEPGPGGGHEQAG